MLAEGGDIIIPKAAGKLADSAFKAELSELASGTKPGRQDDRVCTLFKSVGTAISDFAAAELAYEALAKQ